MVLKPGGGGLTLSSSHLFCLKEESEKCLSPYAYSPGGEIHSSSRRMSWCECLLLLALFVRRSCSHAHVHTGVCFYEGQILGLSAVTNVFRPSEANGIPVIPFGISLGIM